MAQKSRRRVTLKDIAGRTGYSINTVSKALRNAPDLADATKALIQKTGEDMGFVMNDVAGSLRSGLTRTLALIIGDISNPLFAIIAKEVEHHAHARGYTVLVMNTGEDEALEEEAIRAAMSKNVDGVLLFPTQHGNTGIRRMLSAGVPCVLMGRRFEDKLADSVLFDDFRGGYLAAEALIARGRKKYMMVNAPKHISSARERQMGFERALSDHGMDAARIVHLESALGGCYEALGRLLDEGARFDALFAFSDLMAFEAVCALNERNLRVPEDVSLVGYDDIQSKLMIPFPLTTICASKSAMAAEAVSLLMCRIAGDTEDFPMETVLPVELKPRASV